MAYQCEAFKLVVEDVDKGHSGFNKMPKQAFSPPSKS